ncbi:AAA family ATPase [Salmonella enterica subsp. enterica]|nr:AAA family ATPase [Salmonella enterica subsp. enterica]
MSKVSITSVKFTNFKALEDYSISMNDINILVGPNNSGKSTIISAFRVLQAALKIANTRSAGMVPSYTGGNAWGHRIPENSIPISLENVHTNYSQENTKIEFRLSNANRLIILFPPDGGCILNIDAQGKPVKTPTAFKKSFPIFVQVVPVLGPFEQEEIIVTDETVKRSLGTPRASRHFRNYWYKNQEGFDSYKNLLEKTWPGMTIQLPELTSILEKRLVMFYSENRNAREIFWAGFGFQIWCQLLTHLARANEFSLTVIDEPEVYLHPDVQRQLLAILRDIDVDVLLATHSTEILGEADPTEILLVDKRKRSAKRLRDVEGVQEALDSIGSIQNITLTQLARTKKILFVEGLGDYKIIRRFAKTIGLQELFSGSEITAFESGGFSSWERVKALAWGLQNTLGADIRIGAVYDRDYWCDAQITETEQELRNNLHFAYIHKRKEIENYLLVPCVLNRVLEKYVNERNSRSEITIELDESIEDILYMLTANLRIDSQSQYVGKYIEYMKKSGSSLDQATLTADAIRAFEEKWNNLDTRLMIVSGKQTLKELRNYISTKWSVTLTEIRIIDEFAECEIPQDMRELIARLEVYRVN